MVIKDLSYCPGTGTSTWKDVRDSIVQDAKLLEKLTCVFQDCRDSSTILLLSQLFGELLSSKRATKSLVQCGLTLAVLCQIRVCCCLTSNSSSNIQGNNNWQSSGDLSALSLSSSLSMNCTFLNTSTLELSSAEKQNLAANCASSSGNISSANLQCSPQVATALHQLACRVFPLDSRYNTKVS